MGKMVSRAASYGCAPHPDGTPNVVCLCRSKRFKSGAKRGVGDLCPNNSGSIMRSREWAIDLCTAGMSPLLFFLAVLYCIPHHAPQSNNV